MSGPHLLTKIRSPRIMRAVQTMPCSLRIASIIGLQCSGPTTVVGCHLPVDGKGTGTKVTDLAVAAGCWLCHDLVDMRHEGWELLRDRYPAAFYDRLLRGLVETHARLVERGVIFFPETEIVGTPEHHESNVLPMPQGMMP